MAVKKFQRYELKFCLSREQFEAFVRDIAPYVQADTYCPNGKTYPIYTIYFDTDNKQVIRHSLSKPGYKEKFRLRSYLDNPSGDDKIFVELKKKIKGCVSKRRAITTLDKAQKFCESSDFNVNDDYMHNQVLREIVYYKQLYDIKPAAFISYDRLAYFATDNPEQRITFDTNILARDTDIAFGKGVFGTPLLQPGQWICEIKILGSMPIWLASALSKNKIYKSSFSKYGTYFLMQRSKQLKTEDSFEKACS